MALDRIEREVVVAAPVEVVWSAITEPEHVGAWFGDSADVDLRPGGQLLLTWKEYGTFHARVETVEPPHRFAFRWARPADVEPRPGNSTLVEFTLAEEGEGTRLRVVESGFETLGSTETERAKHIADNERGWRAELGHLVEYVSKLEMASRA
jgi:uncharacterized protein YndB with AHSA1/START domain